MAGKVRNDELGTMNAELTTGCVQF
ncbi:MAG: hypothetical protein QOC99_1617, partial [Acidobacteriota bacterium]|nr:hypothetical protein [Acidobacteriota bacterium]